VVVYPVQKLSFADKINLGTHIGRYFKLGEKFLELNQKNNYWEIIKGEFAKILVL